MAAEALEIEAFEATVMEPAAAAAAAAVAAGGTC